MVDKVKRYGGRLVQEGWWHDPRTYVVASDHDRIVAAKDAEIARLKDEVEGLRKDARRLDWVLSDGERGQAVRVQGSVERGWSVIDMSDGLVFLSRGCASPRAAIDSAMSGGEV